MAEVRPLGIAGGQKKRLGYEDTLPLANIPEMGAATATEAGSAGTVPAPAAGDQGKYLRGDKTWSDPPGGSGAASFSSAVNRFFTQF